MRAFSGLGRTATEAKIDQMRGHGQPYNSAGFAFTALVVNARHKFAKRRELPSSVVSDKFI
jgi:hypothetical protein